MKFDPFWYALLTAMIWGAVPVLEKLGLSKAEPAAGLFYRCMGVFLGFAIFGFFVFKPEAIRAVSAGSATLLILGGFLASFVGQICFYGALKHGEVSRLVPISGSYPMMTFFLGIFLLKESANPQKFWAAALIILGIWLLK